MEYRPLHTQAVTLAINMRGVNGSTGSCTWRGYDEVEDFIAAIRYATDPEGMIRAKKVVLVGYSFSAAVLASTLATIYEKEEYSTYRSSLLAACFLSYPHGYLCRVLLGTHATILKKAAPSLRELPLVFISCKSDSLTSQSQLQGLIDEIDVPHKYTHFFNSYGHFWGEGEADCAAITQLDTFLHTITTSNSDNNDNTCTDNK